MSDQPPQPQPLAVAPAPQPTPMAMIAVAIEKGMTPECLEKLCSLQERHERQQAHDRFGEALAGFQRDCPTVFKGRAGARGNYASYEDIMAVAKPHLGRHGISVSFEVNTETEGRLMIGVRVQVGRHAEDRTFPFVIPTDLKANDSQRFGAALSYAKRHALCAALNIVVSDAREDNDADAVEKFLTEQQAEHLKQLLQEAQADRVKFFAWVSTAVGANVAHLHDIPQALYARCESMLRNKIAQRQKEKEAAK